MSAPLIRHETPADIAALRSVNEAAFESGAEAELVARLRENGKIVLSLVAEAEGAVVGHILFTEISMEPAASEHRVVGLAPLAVGPEWHGKGIGSALVRRGLEDCLGLDYRSVVVVGHPSFFAKFGFVPASRFGIACEFDEVPDEAFMARPLGKEPPSAGRAVYQPEFAAAA